MLSRCPRLIEFKETTHMLEVLCVLKFSILSKVFISLLARSSGRISWIWASRMPSAEQKGQLTILILALQRELWKRAGEGIFHSLVLYKHTASKISALYWVPKENIWDNPYSLESLIPHRPESSRLLMKMTIIQPFTQKQSRTGAKAGALPYLLSVLWHRAPLLYLKCIKTSQQFRESVWKEKRWHLRLIISCWPY